MAEIEYLTVDHLSTKDLIRICSRLCVHPEVTWNGTPCWIWCGKRNKLGYGLLNLNYTTHKTHRFFFAWLVYPIPKGLKHGELDHLCRNPSCMNPVHMDFVPHQINVLRGNVTIRKTHCIRGHEFSTTNTYVYPFSGVRGCVICRRNRNPETTRAANRRFRSRHGDRLRAQDRRRYAARVVSKTTGKVG